MSLDQVDFMAQAKRIQALAPVTGEGLEPKGVNEAVLKCVGIPLRVRRAVAGGLEETEALLAVNRWLADDGAWCLVLSSPVGVGKTTAAGYWLARQIEHVEEPSAWLKPRWLPASALAVLDTYEPDWKTYKTIRHLVIDDLGTEFSGKSGAFDSKLDALIDARYAECLPTLITTNLNSKAFRKRVSARVVDRLREGCRWVELQGESRRGDVNLPNFKNQGAK